MEDKYFYDTVYVQECEIYIFQQHTLTNEQYYGSFNKKVDVGVSIGITRHSCDIIVSV